MPFDVTRLVRSSLLLGTLLVLPSACVVGTNDDTREPSHEDDADPSVASSGEALSASDSVATAVASSCSTTAVKGLATQLVEEIQCLRPGTLSRIDGKAGIALGSTVFPYLQTPVVNALVSARNSRGATLTINSGLRTLPQQYLLYRWYKTGRCGISLAATPGTSNHESALAVDVQDSAGWRTYFGNRSLRWLGANDPMHYDFIGSSAVSLKGLSVRAFQRLWNRNHPEDLIVEDGVYGPATEARLAKSPSGGFPVGACSASTTSGSEPAPPPAPEQTEPADVPMVPDANESTDDAPATADATGDGATASAAASADPAHAEAGCAASPVRPAGGSFALAAIAIGAAAIATRRRRRA